MVHINNLDLMRNRNTYSISELESNIEHLSMKTVLNTQKLTEEFCINYIYCVSDIDDGDEESYLFSLNHILSKQPHLNEAKMHELIDAIEKRK